MLHTSIGEVGLNGGGEKSLQLFSGTHKVASLAHTCDAQRQDALQPLLGFEGRTQSLENNLKKGYDNTDM